MEIRLAELAEAVEAEVRGDPELPIRGVCALDASLDEAEGKLSFLSDPSRSGELGKTNAAAVLVPGSLDPAGLELRPALLLCRDPHLAFARIASRFHPLPRAVETRIHPSAVVAETAVLEDPVEIGPFTVVEDGVRIGAGSIVQASCVLGRESLLGRDCLLHPRVVLYPGTRLGDRVRVHSGAVLGADGFGNARGPEGYERIPQVGVLVVEDDVEIGANTCLDRGALTETRIGRGARFDNLCHVAHNCRVGPHTAMAAQVGIAGSTKIGAWCMFGGQAGISGHIEIGEGSIIGPQAGLGVSLPPGSKVIGSPARPWREFWKEVAILKRMVAGRRGSREAGGGAPD